MLTTHALDIEVPGRVLVRALELVLPPACLIAVLGENGSGKSSTLATLAGLRAPRAGHVALDGRPLAAWPRRERALRVGLLPQVTEDPFPSTVLETVLIGRHPHLGFLSWEDEADLAAARAALAACDLAGFEERAIATLSGGERRRVALAAVLAQDPFVALLDEPLNHLDPYHQHQVLRCLRGRAEAGGTVVATLHDPSLAARYADAVLLLYGDGSWDFGTTPDVLGAERLSRLYRLPVAEVADGDRRLFVAR